MAAQHKGVSKLLEEGADVDFQDRAGYTALSEASSAGHTIVCGQLLRALADIDRPAQDGRTALHRASFQNWVPVVRLLLDNGANPDLKDQDGATALDLARSGSMREAITSHDREKNREAAEDRKKRMSERPAAREEAESEEEQPPQPPAEAKQAFEPPPRSILEKRELEAKKKAEATSQQVERDRKYQEAMAELQAQAAKEAAEGGNDSVSYADIQRPLVARVRVVGAGEDRLDGDYRVAYVAKERVEFFKEDDESCQIMWTEYHNEWRMIVGDFKLGSTLYRHKYRPNIKADERLGVPREGWQPWFGKSPAPRLEYLADFGTAEYEEEMKHKAEEQRLRAEAQALQEEEQRGSGARQRTSPAKGEMKREFIEFHSSLDIVVPEATPMSTTAALPSRSKVEVSLHGGERLVETADGLFSPDEVPEDGVGAGGPAVTVVDDSARALAWLEDLGGAPQVPASWDAIQAAKAAAQNLFAGGSAGEARQATTAAIRAAEELLRKLEDPGPDDEICFGSRLPPADEIERFIGVLHSNRSLLLLQQIQAADEAVLKFGAEAAWLMVAKDADKALVADPANFKASFRRARAFFELGELESALADANRVVDHYVRHSSTPNPEAAALRERILEAIQKERRKWNQKAPARWNRGAEGPLVTELGLAGGSEASGEFRSTERRTAAAVPAVRPVRAVASAAPSAPRTGADVEKALLSTLKSDAARRSAYVKEHLTAESVRKFFKRAPPGPDLLAALVRSLADLADAGDSVLAGQLLQALSEAPSAHVQAAMFDAEEQASLSRLLGRVGPEAAAKWSGETREA